MSTIVTAKRGFHTASYQNSFDKPQIELDFLQRKAQLPLQPESLPNLANGYSLLGFDLI